MVKINTLCGFEDVKDIYYIKNFDEHAQNIRNIKQIAKKTYQAIKLIIKGVKAIPFVLIMSLVVSSALTGCGNSKTVSETEVSSSVSESVVFGRFALAVSNALINFLIFHSDPPFIIHII